MLALDILQLLVSILRERQWKITIENRESFLIFKSQVDLERPGRVYWLHCISSKPMPSYLQQNSWPDSCFPAFRYFHYKEAKRLSTRNS
ncbi:hypothetical protein LINPERPRIM_LOCUS32125 [Linum perenne]